MLEKDYFATPNVFFINSVFLSDFCMLLLLVIMNNNFPFSQILWLKRIKLSTFDHFTGDMHFLPFCGFSSYKRLQTK
jgi:hypothetical protein